MGIPGFFSFLKKYNNVNNNLDNNYLKTSLVKQNEIPSQFNYHFFLDFNGAIYTAYYSKTIKTEEALIANTIGYLDILLSIYINEKETENCNLKTLFIALDGVPPRAKIEQQRTRRFHSVKEKQLDKDISNKWGNEKNTTGEDDISNKNTLDTTIITPGTKFMTMLKIAIEHHLKTNSKYSMIDTIIFSSADVPGEGEQKIFKYIKQKNKENFYNDDDKIIIYGLDADLIMLSMISHVNNVYLLREKSHFGSYLFEIEGYEFMYLDIDILKMCLMKEFQRYLNNIRFEDIVRLIDDYVFLMFIIGNDFIPKIPHFSVYNNGVDILMETYCKLYNHHQLFLVDNQRMRINEYFLFMLMSELADIEQKHMCSYVAKRQRRKINMNNIDTEEDRRKQLLKFFPLQHLNIEKHINPFENGWRSRYYDICLNIKYNDYNKNNVVKQYLESLLWTFNYYYGNVISWDWFYQYQFGPTCKDIFEYLEQNANINSTVTKKTTTTRIQMTYDINKLKHEFKLGKPLKQQELLIMVLPMESSKYMINNFKIMYENNDIIKSYFPIKYLISIPFHSMFWECHPILPKINSDIIKKEIKKIYLTNDEQQRNKIGVDFILNN